MKAIGRSLFAISIQDRNGIFKVMQPIYIITSFIIFSLLSKYIFNNIKILGGGSVSLELLFVLIGLCLILLFFQILKLKKIKIIVKKSFFILILFFVYLVNRILIDTQDLYTIKSFTVSTTGGIVLFYFLGAILSLLLSYYSSFYKNKFKIFYYSFFIFVLYHSYLLTDSFSYLLQNVRSDIFLLVDGEHYQRPGDFISIDSIFLSILFMYILLMFYNNKCKKRVKTSLVFILSLILFYGNMIASIFLSQLIGSNKGTVVVSIVLVLILSMQIFLFFNKNKLFKIQNKLSAKKILFSSYIVKKIIKILLFFLSMSLFSAMIMIEYFDINYEMFRIFGFGSGELSSISSRLQLLANFGVQLNYSPIFGNIAVDKLTTGTGTYVHSTIASLLTHTGLIGFFLFIFYIVSAITEKFLLLDDLFVMNGLSIYFIFLFCCLFLLAAVGTFFTWIPLWFLLGSIFPPVYIIRSAKRI